MATKKKMLQAAAGQAGGAALDITDVFSTYLYEGTNQADTIVNNIDLSGEGGMTWIKERTGTSGNVIFDTERGATKRLISYATNAESTAAFDVTAFNSDGFSVGDSIQVNGPSRDYASWTFRKAPKFFDVVTYTGDGTGNRIISHGLNSTPGMLVVRPYDAVSDWFVNHRGNGTAGLKLNTTDATAFSPVLSLDGNLQWDSTTVTLKTNFNNSGVSYVAYVFAHNDGDGEFGPDGDQDIIKCGSYTGNSGGAINVELGFEPQWLMIKNASSNSNWVVLDVMRGFSWDAGNNLVLNANADHAEQDVDENGAPRPTPTGFSLASSNQYGEYNSGSDTYIYMAIRRGPLAQPESGTEVFDVQFNGGNDPSKAPVYQSGFVTDMSIVGLRTGGSVNYPYTGNRLMGIQTLETHNTDAEESGGASFQWDFMNGFIDGVPSVITDTQIAWMWKRAPGFCDVVAYTGDGVAGRTVSHNLGVAPEMMWVKRRDTADNWFVYHSGMNDVDKHLRMNLATDASTSTTRWNSTAPASTEFTLGTDSGVNASGGTYIAYLFATLPGVSKVGSYTADGNAQNIDCGFTSGARFVLIKRTDTGGNWFVLDTARGIVSGNDPLLELNSTGAEDNQYDNLDPYSAGFTVAAYGGTSPYLNISGGTYIFYAIA